MTCCSGSGVGGPFLFALDLDLVTTSSTAPDGECSPEVGLSLMVLLPCE